MKGAGKWGLPEVSLGVLPGTGGTQRLSRLVGKTKSIELMVEGGLHEYEQALELGVINYLWPAEEDGKKWWDRVMEYAWSFCPPNRAAKAVGRIKRSVQTGWELPIESALAVERELQQQLFQSEDAKEGLGAYNQKRKPSFSGR
jgi:enoyl-CoA hydratase/carnithine racemase